MKKSKKSGGAPAKSTGTFNVSASSITRLGGGRAQPGSKKGNAGSFGGTGTDFFSNMRGKAAK